VTFFNPAGAAAAATAGAYVRALLESANLHVLRRVSPSLWERVGLHAERGPESAGFLLKLMGAHDLVHRRQIDRILSTAAPREMAPEI